jgi:hypothetical protein
VSLFDGVGDLPLFNPDRAEPSAGSEPPPVTRWRQALYACDGLLIASPEYGHSLRPTESRGPGGGKRSTMCRPRSGLEGNHPCRRRNLCPYRPGLLLAYGLGPQVLPAEEALDAFGVADQGAQLHASPAMKAGVDGQTEGEAHELGPGPVAAARSRAGRFG